MEITNAKEYATINTQKLDNIRAGAWLLLPQAFLITKNSIIISATTKRS
jgi:hypothetical protein